MKYKVYHADNPTFHPPHPPLHACSLVAEVECNNLEEVFRVTNHIDCSWWNNPEVKWHKDGSRSTSVGDIVIDENDVQWRCEMAGWKNKADETITADIEEAEDDFGRHNPDFQ